ncbi:MAG: hypothetical protein NTW87_08805 [Planctomycetota bacterium]|nr:hypothetical protein [Planctomycetota bacterium]
MTTPKLADSAVTNVKIAALAVSADKITSGAASANMVLTADGTGGASFQLPPTPANFSGTLAGDVIGPQSATVVSKVGGETAANVASGAQVANAATNSNTASTVVKRDGSGNFSAGTISANLTGNVTGDVTGSAASFTGSLAGDVTGGQGTTVVSKVQGTVPTTTGLGLLGATDAPAARTALGLGDAATKNVGNVAGTVAAGDDPRLSNARTPTGTAGGDLTGTYPNPGIANTAGSSIITAINSATGGTISTARLDVGTGANQIVQLGADTKLPAVDGSKLTNLPTTDADFALSQVATNAEKLGRTTNDADRYVRLNGSDTDKSGSSCFVDQGTSTVMFSRVMDNFLGSSPDPNIWSTSSTGQGGVSEGGGCMTLGTGGYTNPGDDSATAIANGLGALDLKAANCEVLISFSSAVTDGNGHMPSSGGYRADLLLTDGSTDVPIFQNSGGSYGGLFNRLVVNTSTLTCYVYTSPSSTSPSTVDLSPLTGAHWWLKFYATGYRQFNNTTLVLGTIHVYSIGYARQGSPATSTWQSSGNAISSSSGGWLVIKTNASLTTCQVTTDGGSHWSNCTSGTVFSTTAGTSLKLRGVADVPSSLDVSNTGINIKALSYAQVFYK